MREIELAASDGEIAEVAAAVSATPLVAIDTEFVRETTYYPQLCLIQVATPEAVACVDCLAGRDLEPLYASLFRADCTWVLHSARQDLEVLFQQTGRLPHSLIDTQIAAALVGFAPQVGLETLLTKTVGVVLGESYARTDWSRRPLPAPALRYALDDVRYLPAALRHLEESLAALERSDWLAEECRRLLAEPPVADPVSIWARLKGGRALTNSQQHAALKLVGWREAAAQRSNRPRRWILPDDVLLAIAQALPADLHDLRTIVAPKFASRYGAEVLAAVAAPSDSASLALVEEHGARPVAEKQRVRDLQDRVRRRAAELGLTPEILATRRDLTALAAGHPPQHLVNGWRAAALATVIG
jgi:ribonuclease D